jgi:hypothetical protein
VIAAVGASWLAGVALVAALALAAAAPAHSAATDSATARWRVTLPDTSTLGKIAFAGDAVVAAGDPTTVVLERSSGQLRWRTKDHTSTIVTSDTTIFFGTSRGGVGARRVSDGALRWHRASVCPPPAWEPVARVSAMIRNGADIIVGCNGGRVIRLNATSGAIESRSGTFGVDQVQSIVPLGVCAYAVTGWSSGAMLLEHSEIIGCRRLEDIVTNGPDTYILGAVGNIAIVNDICCHGRPDVYQPATIFHADLATGATSRAVDLRPEPERYPADRRPIGQGATAGLEGNALYLGVDHTLYTYADAIALKETPVARRIASNLVSPPLFLPDNRIAVRARYVDGTEAFSIDHVHDARIEPVARIALAGDEMIGYEATFLPNVITLQRFSGDARYIRITDGRSLHVTEGCLAHVADEEALVMTCKATQMVGNQYLQDIVLYNWPAR